MEPLCRTAVNTDSQAIHRLTGDMDAQVPSDRLHFEQECSNDEGPTHTTSVRLLQNLVRTSIDHSYVLFPESTHRTPNSCDQEIN